MLTNRQVERIKIGRINKSINYKLSEPFFYFVHSVVFFVLFFCFFNEELKIKVS